MFLLVRKGRVFHVSQVSYCANLMKSVARNVKRALQKICQNFFQQPSSLFRSHTIKPPTHPTSLGTTLLTMFVNQFRFVEYIKLFLH